MRRVSCSTILIMSAFTNHKYYADNEKEMSMSGGVSSLLCVYQFSEETINILSRLIPKFCHITASTSLQFIEEVFFGIIFNDTAFEHPHNELEIKLKQQALFT